jgi:hypothetical protein
MISRKQAFYRLPPAASAPYALAAGGYELMSGNVKKDVRPLLFRSARHSVAAAGLEFGPDTSLTRSAPNRSRRT